VNRAKWRLVVAAALFLGWISWLSYSALVKNRGPVVSRAQAAVATQPVAAEVSSSDGKPNPHVKVIESFTKVSPAAGTELYVINLPDAKGFDGPGLYVLLLNPDPLGRTFPVNGKDLRLYSVAGSQRSPGYELAGGSPMIYKLTPEIRAQVKHLYP
jgi:hypothetical protein